MSALGSVRGRITFLAAMLVAGTLAVASLVILQIVERDVTAAAEEAVRDRLAERADDPSEPRTSGGDGFEFGVFRQEGELVFGVVLLEGEPVAEVEINLTTRRLNEAFDLRTGADLTDPELRSRLETATFVLLGVEGGEFLVGATSAADIEISTSAVRRALLVTVPLIAVAVAAVVWWLVGRALRPVHAINRQVTAITSASLSERVPVPAGRDEVADLAVTMNGMLDRLETGDARLRRFSADASHELRSPLATVRAAAELLERNPGSPRAGRLASDIVAEADRMEALIADLLALARQEAVPSASGEVVDLAVITAGVAPDLDLQREGSTLVCGDSDQLSRAVRNLVDNARRHAASTIRLGVSATSGWVSVSVEDDGPGVAPEDRHRVFERFTRLDDVRDRDAGGTGLGLALVKAIVEAHGGTVRLDESPSLGGARFVLDVPAAH